MANVITTISQYLVLGFMVVYVLDCFAYFTAKDRSKRTSNLRVQMFCIFVVHFLSHVCLFLNEDGNMMIIVYYLIEIFIAIMYIILYHIAYRHASRLLTNNIAFLMLIGYTMLLRLNTKLAVKQFILASVGLIACAFIPLLLGKFPQVRGWRNFFAIAGILFLITTLIPGLKMTMYGSSNWISIAGISIQPMEFVKILFIFFAASSLVKVNEFKELVINACIAIAFMLILILENDFGAVFLFYITYIMMVYLATSRPIFAIGGIAMMVLAIFVGYILFKHSLFAHIIVRVRAWKDPFAYQQTDGYQVSESLFGIGTGGFIGSGLGRGMPYLIPVAESDFIFSAICEEMGVAFGLELILIYVSSFIAMANVAMKCKDPFYKYVTFGISVTYIMQVFLNIGGATKFIPSTGVTLPLVSYGVSSVFSTLIMFAIVQYTYTLVSKEVDDFEDEKYRIIQKARRQRAREFAGNVPGNAGPSRERTQNQ